jgi:oligopeptide transport system substrate-binding protein
VGPTTSPTGIAPTVLRLSTVEPDSLDPIAIDAPHELLLADQVFDGLVEYEPQTLQTLPALAREWEVKQGGAVIVFHLRKGVRFQDGTPVTANDFVFAWSRLADPLESAPFAFLLERVDGYAEFQRQPVSQIDGLDAPDERTLVVRLRSPWPDFVSLTGHPALSPVPSAADPSTFGTSPVGTGPYRLRTGLSTGTPVILERFPRFYGRAPATDVLQFEVAPEPDDAWPDFLAGELDQATIPASALADAQSRFGSGGIVPLARVLYCGFNRQDDRFRDERLGLAASLALDRDALASGVYAGLAIPASGFVPPSIPGAPVDACGDRCRQDVDEARKLVSGLPRDSKTFALDYTSSTVGDALARNIASQLGEAGFRVTPRPHDEGEYIEMLLEDRQEFFCLVWTADYPRQQALLEPLFLPGSADNHAGVDDTGLTELLVKAREERSPTKRQRRYGEAEVRALGRMHLVPVVWFRSHLAVQPYVEGFAVDPLGMFDASALRIER